MSLKIHPSHAIIIRADASISECIQLMREHQVGSVLIVNDRDRGDLVGIFTERDLIYKIEILQRGDYWTHPIRTIMTQPVRTLDVSKLEQAAEVMLKHQIRHLPITVMNPKTHHEITLGIVSMRDLFKVMFQNQQTQTTPFSPIESKLQIKPKVSLISKDENFVTFIEKALVSFISAEVLHADLQTEFIESCHLLVVDLDRLDSSIWTKLLKTKNHDPILKSVIVVFDPSLQTKEITQILEKIGNSEKFWILKKPIDILHLYEELKSVSFE